VANASETNGPYPSDGSNTVNGMVSNVLQQSGVVRSDIRASFGSSTNVAPGVPLTLKLSVVNSNDNCAALSGYAVYLWHCTRDGAYSLYSNGVQAENYLRGVQVTDANGAATFTTIFPGCYSGRYPHIHFEVYPSLSSATLYTNRILTSQMALPRDVCSTVYGSASGYSASVGNLAQVTLANDNVFGDNSTAQMTQMTPALSGDVSAGYDGTILVGVPV
jgi:protocatechuate 3,4-dioxygenase beta subunit